LFTGQKLAIGEFDRLQGIAGILEDRQGAHGLKCHPVNVQRVATRRFAAMTR
jgi:hypothetical protein